MAAKQMVGAYRSIALVDLSFLFKKNYMAMGRDAAPGEAAQKTLDNLAGVRESVEHVVVCCDSPPYKRKELYEGYKAQREAPSDEETAQKRWLIERMAKDGYVVARHKGSEADDVIATLAGTYGAWCSDVRIIGSDKDLAQCVNDHVRMYVPPSGKRPAEVRGPEQVMAKYGVSPAQMPLWQALVGDKGDNVPGVPGVGPVKAAKIVRDCQSLSGIGQVLATGDEGEPLNATWRMVAEHWDSLPLALSLVTLDKAVPLDAEALLQKPQQTWEEEPTMQDDSNQPQQPNGITEADWVPISPAPANGQAAPKAEAKPESKVETKTEAKGEPKPAPAQEPSPKDPGTEIVRSYGEVDDDLQPQDLRSAKLISQWVYDGRLYGQFPSVTSIFTIILRGKELGLKATTALASFHLIEGKPAASADLIHSLAERDPNCEYFRLIESTPTSATWETKHRLHPEATRYTYTLDEARDAGLLEPSKRTGAPSMWVKRPRDMCSKTAKSKLARIVYPGSCLGLRSPEEMEEA